MYLEYKVDARKIERQFRRELVKRHYFLTAKGHVNRLIDYGKTEILIMTEKGKEPIHLKRSSIRKAISFFFFKRTAIREDFEKFSNFTSAVFAIIMDCFKGKSKLQKLKNGLFRITMLATRFHFSGLERDPDIIKLDKELNGNYVLFNYKTILESPQCLKMLEDYDLYCIVDSGAYSFFNEKNKDSKKSIQQPKLFDDELLNEMLLEGYAGFINKHKSNPRILGFFPLDCIDDPQTTRKNLARLKELTPGANIYPVWQISDTLDELDRLVGEEPEKIGIGGCVPYLSSRKQVVHEILTTITQRHPNIAFHGLGIANEMLQEFQLFSADSTSLLNPRKWDERKIYLPNGERVEAPGDMSVMEIIKHNLRFLIGLEQVGNTQLSLIDFAQGA